ncbi:MAG TPA: type II toxin-antitoxin system VapC family toxin [Dehalococcoidia bacterium]|nr:type II toxin-antitoxin system VapC family toxin [Dehalococcoidia bacterium]
MVSSQIPAEGLLVFDSSAVLAWLQGETGKEVVQPLLQRSTINTVNWAEVIQRGVQLPHATPSEMRAMLEAEGLTITDFSIDEAVIAGQLMATTRNAGLSLGDRACLASAMLLEVSAVTADGSWRAVSVGVDIILIR